MSRIYAPALTQGDLFANPPADWLEQLKAETQALPPVVGSIALLTAAQSASNYLVKSLVRHSGRGEHYFGHASKEAEQAADDWLEAEIKARRYKRHRASVRATYQRRAEQAFARAQRFARMGVAP